MVEYSLIHRVIKQMSTKPEPDLNWTKEQRREWCNEESRALFKWARENTSVKCIGGCIIRQGPIDSLEYAVREGHYRKQRAISDESTPHSRFVGDILLAVDRMRNDSGFNVTSVKVDGMSVEIGSCSD